jgi:hypothetical protein
MRIKHKQKKPDTVTDQFEKLDRPDATETDLKLAEKNFRAFLKEMSLQQSSVFLNCTRSRPLIKI